MDGAHVGQVPPSSMRDALIDAWARSDWLFELVPRQRWLTRSITLRHPFLFYVGHLPAFAHNQIATTLGIEPHDPQLDALFARGIDPADEAAARASGQVCWPEPEQVIAYRDAVRRAVLGQLDALDEASARGVAGAHTVLPLVLEHELMHHETLLYMIARLDPGELVRPAGWRPSVPGPAPRPVRVEIAPGTVQLGADPEQLPFGWDNEFPSQRVEVGGLEMDRYPVTIERYRAFVEAGGYQTPELWRPEDWAWAAEGGLSRPVSWREEGGALSVRSLDGWHPIDEVGGWPVQVSLAEALAFCRWAGARLPTEAELHRAAFTTPDGEQRPRAWGHDVLAPGHGALDFAVYGRTPVGSHAAGRSSWGIDELVGNGWEWTSTPFLPRPGFAPIHPSYPGYSADFFDGAHFVVFGGSWATDARLLRPSFRNWYQARYPFPFTSFRTLAP